MKAVTVMIEQEKLEALGYYLKKENKTVQSELEKSLNALYESMVPEEAREYIAFQAEQRMEAKANKTQKEQKTRKPTAKSDAAGPGAASMATIKEKGEDSV